MSNCYNCKNYSASYDRCRIGYCNYPDDAESEADTQNERIGQQYGGGRQMNNITKEPYAEWLEDSLSELVGLHPESIGIVAIMSDGSTGTNYYNADNRDRLVMCEAIQIDSLEELIRANADLIRNILEESTE